MRRGGGRENLLGDLPSCTPSKGRGASVGLRTTHGCTSAAVDHTGSVGTTYVTDPSWLEVARAESNQGSVFYQGGFDLLVRLNVPSRHRRYLRAQAIAPGPRTGSPISARLSHLHPKTLRALRFIRHPTCLQHVTGAHPLLCSTRTAAGEAQWGWDEAALHPSAGCCGGRQQNMYPLG